MSKMVSAAAIVLAAALGAESLSVPALAQPSYGRGAPPRSAASAASNIRGPGAYEPGRGYAHVGAGGTPGGYGYGSRDGRGYGYGYGYGSGYRRGPGYGYALGAGVAGLALGAELAGGYGYGGGYYSAPYAGGYYAAPSYSDVTQGAGYAAPYGDAGYPPDADAAPPSYTGSYDQNGGYAAQSYAGQAYAGQAYAGQAYSTQTYQAQTYTGGGSPCDRCGGYDAPPAAYPVYAPPPPVYVSRPPCGC